MADRALEGRGVWKKSAATGLWELHEPTGMDTALDALMHGSMADINTAVTSAAFHEASAEQAQQRRAAAAARIASPSAVMDAYENHGDEEAYQAALAWRAKKKETADHTFEVYVKKTGAAAHSAAVLSKPKVTIGLPHQNSGLPVNALAGMIGCVVAGLEPQDSDQRLLTVPKIFGGDLPTLEAIEAAYRYDLPEDRVAEHVAHWKARFEAVEGARARQRRVAARVPLLLCRQRYYDQLEEGEVPGGDVVVKVAQPGIDGVFKHVARFL